MRLHKMFTVLALAFAPVMVAGCQSLPVIDAPVGEETAVDEKTIYFAEAVYNTGAKTYLTAVESGALKGEAKATSKALLIRAYDVLMSARQAYTLGQAASFQDKVKELQALIASIQSFTNKGDVQ